MKMSRAQLAPTRRDALKMSRAQLAPTKRDALKMSRAQLAPTGREKGRINPALFENIAGLLCDAVEIVSTTEV